MTGGSADLDKTAVIGVPSASQDGLVYTVLLGADIHLPVCSCPAFAADTLDYWRAERDPTKSVRAKWAHPTCKHVELAWDIADRILGRDWYDQDDDGVGADRGAWLDVQLAQDLAGVQVPSERVLTDVPSAVGEAVYRWAMELAEQRLAQARQALGG